ncbi:MAG: hypothetical protein EOP13_11790, partial [Pseudomonas sp.]|uniref:hypothetical protein n=1 Tax=Pseudomonas sp. TaxID=306 RepID=UPI0011F9C80C
DYLCSEEWATKAQDILWRRTKLGLFTTDEEHQKVQAYLDSAARSKGAVERIEWPVSAPKIHA